MIYIIDILNACPTSNTTQYSYRSFTIKLKKKNFRYLPLIQNSLTTLLNVYCHVDLTILFI